jgi:hypothetical protein
MNTLIGQDFLQINLNKFLFVDVDLIPWKMTCKACLDFPHNMTLKRCGRRMGHVMLKSKIVTIDASRSVKEAYSIDIDDLYLQLTLDLRVFDSKFNDTSNLTRLILPFSQDGDVRTEHLSGLTSLTYLDLGMYNHFTDDVFVNLKNLETLYLRTNTWITSAIFQYTPKLCKLQIPDNSPIDKQAEIPSTVATVIVIDYQSDPVKIWYDINHRSCTSYQYPSHDPDFYDSYDEYAYYYS